VKVKRLFVCGAGRSGTTFLWKILNNSSAVNLATEIHYFSALYHNGFLYNYKKMKRKTGSVSLDGLIHCLTQINHFGMYWEKSQPFTVKEIRSYFSTENVDEKNIYKFLMERDLSKSGKPKKDIKYIGEKTPLNVFHIKQILKWFPDALVLFIYRNPIDVLKSEVNKKMKPDYFIAKGNPFYPYGLVVFVFFEWLLAALIALYHHTVHKKNVLVVSYEQLNAHQKESLQKICSVLDIDYSENLCVFKKIASSYQGGKNASYWYPPKFVSLIYRFLLNPFSKLLDRRALNAEHAMAKKRHSFK